MHKLKRICNCLGIAQQAVAQTLGCTQSKAGHDDKGRTRPPGVAARLIELSARQGLAIGFYQVCGATPLPGLPDKAAPMAGLHGVAAASGEIGTARAPAWPALRWWPRSCMEGDRCNGGACTAGVLAFQEG